MFYETQIDPRESQTRNNIRMFSYYVFFLELRFTLYTINNFFDFVTIF